MSIESVVGKIIIIALVGIGLYSFFALVDLIRAKGDKQMIKQTTCYCCDKPIEPEWLPEEERRLRRNIRAQMAIENSRKEELGLQEQKDETKIK